MQSITAGLRIGLAATALLLGGPAVAQDMEIMAEEAVPVSRACQTYWATQVVGYKVCVTEYSDGSQVTTVNIIYSI